MLWKADGEDIRDKEGHWVGMEGAFNVWIYRVFFLTPPPLKVLSVSR